jgi:4-amino-4-deoxy-L-arabinose transferase-like glycosyltransferase
LINSTHPETTSDKFGMGVFIVEEKQIHGSSQFTRTRIFLILMLLFLLAFAFQGSRGIYAPDEGFYTTIAKSMVETGDYFVPRLNHEVWLDKPPLNFWGIAFGLRILGINEWGARFFHALCYILTIGVVYLLGNKLAGKRLGILAAIMFATMPLPFAGANVVTPDTPLTLFTTLAFFFFWKSIEPDARLIPLWKILVFICLGLGFLTKGPAVILPALAMLVFLLVQRRLLKYLMTPWTLLGLILFCFLGLGWYVLIIHSIPGALAYFWDNQVMGRTVSARYSRNVGIIYASIYIPILIGGALPWSVSWFRSLWKKRQSLFKKAFWREIRNNPPGMFLVSWIGTILLTLCLASSKLPLYALPLFPALAIFTARGLSRSSKEGSSGKKAQGLFPINAFLLGIWIVLLLSLKMAAAHYASRDDMRAVYNAILPHLPDNPYEIVAVEDHLEGLTFYNIALVERVTTSKSPYPFFVVPEHLDEEIAELPESKFHHVFITRRERRAEKVRRGLKAKNIVFQEYELPFERRLFVCNPPKSVSSEVRVVVLGDTGKGEGKNKQFLLSSTLFLVYAEKSFNDGVLLLGDNLYMEEDSKGMATHTPSETARIEFEEPFLPLLKNNVPFYAALGNHDLDHGLEEFELNYPLFNMKGRRYYSRKMGEDLVEFFMLDSNTLNENDQEQAAWFENALSQSKANWKVAVLHHPIHSTGSHVPSPARQKLLEPIFDKYGVSIVLQGHNHLYERLAPINGIHYLTVGNGGTVDEGGLKPNCPERLAGNDQTNVFLMIEFSKNSCHLTAYDKMGNVIDEDMISRNRP